MSILSPGLVLAVVLTLIGAQVARLVTRGRGPYALTVGLAAVGLVAGEVVAYSGFLAGPPLGVLHPLTDAATIAALEVAGLWLSPLRPA